MTHSGWGELRNEIDAMRKRGRGWEKWVVEAARILNEAFGDESGDGPDRVARKYEGEDVQAESVERVIQRFLRDIGLM